MLYSELNDEISKEQSDLLSSHAEVSQAIELLLGCFSVPGMAFKLLCQLTLICSIEPRRGSLLHTNVSCSGGSAANVSQELAELKGVTEEWPA